MSTAWIYGVIGVHNWQIALFDPRAAEDVFGKNHQTLIASTYMPKAKVEPVEGGLFVAAEGLRHVAVAEAVDPHHAGFERADATVGLLEVAGPNRRGQAVDRVVGQPYILLIGVVNT